MVKINRIDPATGKIETLAWYGDNLPVEECAALYLAGLCNFHNYWDDQFMDKFRARVKLSQHGIALFEHNGVDYTALREKPKKSN